jgi:hypothetical protein
MPDIYWLIAAQRRYLEAMQPGEQADVWSADYQAIGQRLAATFPDAAAVIVRDRLHGYRNFSDRHILLVEVVHRARAVEPIPHQRPGDAGPGGEPERPIRIGWPEFCETGEAAPGQPTMTTAHIVKIAGDRVGADGAVTRGSSILRAELGAWERCRPVGMTHDSILMSLRAGAIDRDGNLLSILYEDASHVIGPGRITPLGDAVLDCCVWGLPTETSLSLLIRSLYERFGGDFYSRSRVESDAAANLAKLRAWKRFGPWLERWNDSLTSGDAPQLDRLRTRREVLGMLSYQKHELIDPVDFLRSVQELPETCPLLLWGCSHGDLHGHNVLLSELEDDVTLPAVFDFADMSLENLVGWDFVKLETELKSRALPLLANGPEPAFLFQVLAFEVHLARCTLAIHNEQKPPEPSFAVEGLNRLAGIVLTIRQQARRHLGVQRLRDRQWLEEYYFLLTCYGVHAGLFDSYQTNRRQLASAYISSGVAARQLSIPSNGLDDAIRVQEEQARAFIRRGAEFDPGTCDRPRLPGEYSYHPRLAFARTWVRCDDRPYRLGAIRILDALRTEYPHVLEIDDELALAYLEAGQESEFQCLLSAVERRYNVLSEEFLSRLGRFWKLKAIANSASGSQPAREHCLEALTWYRQAYGIRRHYYPGINVAGLEFVLGRVEAATHTARQVFESLETSRAGPSEQAWVDASRGDALVIFGRNHEAEAAYGHAVAISDPRAKASMRRQLALLVESSPEGSGVRAYWSSEKLDAVFGPLPPSDRSS